MLALVYSLTAIPVRTKFRHHQEPLRRLQLIGMLETLREELIDGVDGIALDTGAHIELFGGHDLIGRLQHARGAGIAVGNGIPHDAPFGIEQHVIDAPGIDPHACRLRPERFLARSQSGDDLVGERSDIPAVVPVNAALGVLETVDALGAELAILHPSEVDPSARRPDIHRRIAFLSPQIHHVVPFKPA